MNVTEAARYTSNSSRVNDGAWFTSAKASALRAFCARFDAVHFYSTSSHIFTLHRPDVLISDGRALSECCQGFVTVVMYARGVSTFCESHLETGGLYDKPSRFH